MFIADLLLPGCWEHNGRSEAMAWAHRLASSSSVSTEPWPCVLGQNYDRPRGTQDALCASLA